MAKVKFGDVVCDTKGKVDRSNNPYEFYVAGDHMDTEDLTIRRRGRFATDDVGPAFIREFHKGQILYGSRRTYLKKIAVADFDGVTANTTFVLETRDENVLRQRLIPFIMYTEGFTDWAIKKSKGSTNPYVLFSDLAEYKFELPSLEKQDELAELLWGIVEAKDAYQELLRQTDELVKSQFIEMFDSHSNRYNQLKLSDACDQADDIKCGPFGTQLKQSEYTTQGVAIWGIPQINSGFIIPPSDYVSVSKAQELQAFSLIPGDIAMSRKGNVGQCAIYPQHLAPGIIASDVLRIRISKGFFDPLFLMLQLHLSEGVRRQILRVSNGTVMAGVNVTKLKSIMVYAPPLEEQKVFAAFVNQGDKSKSKITQALSELDALCKQILKQELDA